MRFFSQLVTAFCASSVFIGVLYIICPDGVISKSVKYVLGLCFLLSVIAAAGFTVKSSDFEINTPAISETDTSLLDTAVAKQVYSYALKKAEIYFKEITVCTNKAVDGSIIINKIIICSDCEAEKIREALGEVAQNYEVEIINE